MNVNERPPPQRGSLLAHVEGAEKAFLAGRQAREADLESAVRIFLEFLRAFESFEFVQPCVTVPDASFTRTTSPATVESQPGPNRAAGES